MDAPLLIRRLDPEADRRVADRPPGGDRHVGVEVEFAGLDLQDAAAVVADVLGGVPRPRSDYEFEIDAGTLGTFRVEVDNHLLQQLGREREDGRTSVLRSATESVLSAAIGSLHPLELVSPPLPWTEIGRVDEIVARLGEAGATGTRDGVLAAFGVHYNPEVHEPGARSIRDHLRAFLVLEPWLRAELEVDWSRRLTPYIDLFPVPYVREVLAPDSAPDLDAFVTRYVLFNPTRNRSLDLLPLLAELRPTIVRAAVDDPRLKPRPTFHYRLTNSLVGLPGWTVTRGWRYWLVVEDLARDADRLESMAAAFAAELAEPLGRLRSLWAERTRELLAT